MKVSIILELADDTQSHYFEQYLRDKLILHPNRVIDYTNLPNTKELYKNDKVFKKLLKDKKKLQERINNYIDKNN